MRRLDAAFLAVTPSEKLYGPKSRERTQEQRSHPGASRKACQSSRKADALRQSEESGVEPPHSKRMHASASLHSSPSSEYSLPVGRSPGRGLSSSADKCDVENEGGPERWGEGSAG